jgi:DNA-directed RNA polymerase subunit RPC12/RpoP
LWNYNTIYENVISTATLFYRFLKKLIGVLFMQPLMNRRDYGSNNYDEIAVSPIQGPEEPEIRLVMPQDYDSPIVEEVVPEEPQQSSNLKCPFCSTKHPFNPQSLGRVKNFNCPDCSGKVPSVTVMKQAGNEYVSSIELVSEETDENDLVEDVKESLKEIKKIEKEESNS